MRLSNTQIPFLSLSTLSSLLWKPLLLLHAASLSLPLTTFTLSAFLSAFVGISFALALSHGLVVFSLMPPLLSPVRLLRHGFVFVSLSQLFGSCFLPHCSFIAFAELDHWVFIFLSHLFKLLIISDSWILGFNDQPILGFGTCDELVEFWFWFYGKYSQIRIFFFLFGIGQKSSRWVCESVWWRWYWLQSLLWALFLSRVLALIGFLV